MEDIRRLIKQEPQAHAEGELLDHQAKEGRRLREEALWPNQWAFIFCKVGRKRLSSRSEDTCPLVLCCLFYRHLITVVLLFQVPTVASSIIFPTIPNLQILSRGQNKPSRTASFQSVSLKVPAGATLSRMRKGYGGKITAFFFFSLHPDGFPKISILHFTAFALR